MKFIEKIRGKLKLSKYEFSRQLGITPQAYHSLSKATENISLKALIGLRRAGNVSDKALAYSQKTGHPFAKRLATPVCPVDNLDLTGCTLI